MVSLPRVILLLLLPILSKAAPIAGIKYIFSFGDSYTTTTFDITGTKPNAINPLGNPAFPGVTTDNGINWIGHLVKTFNTSETLSYNFAYGGATVDTSIVAESKSTIKSFVNQMSDFQNYVASHPSYAPWKSSNSLFAVWFGINDLGNTFKRSGETALIGKVLDKYFEEAQALHAAGGRYFLFLTVPPTDRSPKITAMGATDVSLLKSAISNYNSVLVQKATAFSKTNNDSTIWVYDTQVPFNNALDNPTSYGAPNDTCESNNGVSCLWWGSYHPGQAIQKLVAEGVVATLRGVFF